MKNYLVFLAAVIVGLIARPAGAQPGGAPPGPGWDGAMAKLFGDNAGFSATMEMHMTGRSGQEMTMTDKMAHLEGKARMEMDMSSMQGGRIPPQAAAQMKQMGMSKMVMLIRRDKGVSYLIYPDMKAYVENPLHETNTPVSDYKVDETKLGQETVDGHDCAKCQEVVTGPDGATHESIIWKASDLKGFPIKIQMTSKDGNNMVMFFKDLKLEKPDAALFEPPTDYTKYDSAMNMMMSRMRGAPPQ